MMSLHALALAAALAAAGSPTAADVANFEEARKELAISYLLQARFAGICSNSDPTGYWAAIREAIYSQHAADGGLNLQLEARGQYADGQAQAGSKPLPRARCLELTTELPARANRARSEYDAMQRGFEQQGWDLP